MKLENLIKFLEDTIGLPAIVTNCKWVMYHKYNKWCQFKTPTGLQVIHCELWSNDGYEWKLHLDSCSNWDLHFMIYGRDNNQNSDLRCNCGCYK